MINSKLYLILDADVVAKKNLLKIADKAMKGGVDIIQLRAKNLSDKIFLKTAKLLRKLTLKYNALFIINDRADIARLSDADGMHLGQSDLQITSARLILKPKKIVGISCSSLKEAFDAQRCGADYIGIGPIFKTNTKPSVLPIGLKSINKLKNILKIPFFAIGGIDEKNIKKLIALGAKRVAVTRAICLKKDAKIAAANFKKILENKL